ncbi:MAG TPA: ATP-binding protein, partial [Sphaerochaeta sp.]|nr:ATP-binding protein [Sphaerochaeta sp.]
MKKKFWLERIQLHKSPGFEAGTFPPVEELGEHLNVIWGPNAVGKSTLMRAMRSLIWGARDNAEVEATGLLKADDSPWNLSLSNGRLHQKRLSDDQELLLPGRNDELSESYWFTLHELLQQDASHASTFLREVQTRMQGGVDLEGASAHAGGITSFSTGAIKVATNAKQATEYYKQVLRSQDEHRDIQDKIALLEQEVAQN